MLQSTLQSEAKSSKASQMNHSTLLAPRDAEPEPFFGSGASNFARTGANLVKQAPELETGCSASRAPEFRPGSGVRALSSL